jgi:crossover junction endodeoxyribonuclease RuvC
MRIVGIDPGLQLTGYGCVELAPGAHEPTLLEAGVIRLSPRKSLPVRLRELHEELARLFDEITPALVVVEQLFSHYKHVRTGILMGHARGVVLLAAAQRGIELDELMPNEVKKAITGNGHASKQIMQQAVAMQCRLDTLPSPPDVADAIAIALCASRRIAHARECEPIVVK